MQYRRGVLGVAAIGCVLLMLPSCGTSPGHTTPERVILIVVDTLRRDRLSCYGSPLATPNIDRIAERGQVFQNMMASYHQTSMSMASLFTGRTPSIEFGTLARPLFWNGETWCGLARFATQGSDASCIPPAVPTLATAMADAGYWTVGIASNQFLYEPSGYSRGFDDWVEVGEHPTDEGALGRIALTNAPATRHWKLVDKAVFAALERRESDRFFLYVHYMDVHDYGFEQIPYSQGVREVDRAIGSLLDGLEEQGLLEGALVVFTADHGERLNERHAIVGNGGHIGNPSFQEVLEVPLLVAPPIERDTDAPMRTEDLYRLILEAVGAPSPRPSELDSGELLLTETEYRTLIRGSWKTVIRRSDGAQQLFDLSTDPTELHDLAALRPDIAGALSSRAAELSLRLSARRAVLERISPMDRARLKALGYDYDPGDPGNDQPGRDAGNGVGDDKAVVEEDATTRGQNNGRAGE